MVAGAELVADLLVDELSQLPGVAGLVGLGPWRHDWWMSWSVTVRPR